MTGPSSGTNMASITMPESFTCTLCRVDKPSVDFRHHIRGYRVGRCRDCERSDWRQWASRNPEERRRKNREGMARYRAKNLESVRERERLWRTANADKVKSKLRAYIVRRFFWARAHRLKGEGRAAPREIAALWKAQRGRCALSGRKLDRTAHLDHKIPRKDGGSDRLENLQWLCSDVNFAKRALGEEAFIALCQEVAKWNE